MRGAKVVSLGAFHALDFFLLFGLIEAFRPIDLYRWDMRRTRVKVWLAPPVSFRLQAFAKVTGTFSCPNGAFLQLTYGSP